MRRAAATARLPPCVALVGLPCELGQYYRAWFSLHWPELRVTLSQDAGRVVADLVVVDHPPQGWPPCPTLWLAEVERSAIVIRLGPSLWRTAMPTTARRLKRAIQTCLDGSLP